LPAAHDDTQDVARVKRLPGDSIRVGCHLVNELKLAERLRELDDKRQASITTRFDGDYDFITAIFRSAKNQKSMIDKERWVSNFAE
jgi:hypothetical protein